LAEFPIFEQFILENLASTFLAFDVPDSLTPH
jgi:hypothetical protein